MGLMDNIGKLITEHGSAGIMKERLELLRDQLELIQKDNERLQKENEALSKQNDSLKKQVESKTAADEYVKHRGVLFLRLPSGKIQDEVYCPKCQGPMLSFVGFHPYQCDPCNVTAGFNQGELPRMMAELE